MPRGDAAGWKYRDASSKVQLRWPVSHRDLLRPAHAQAKRPAKGEAEVMDTHDGELPNQDGFKRKKGKAGQGKAKKITKKRGK